MANQAQAEFVKLSAIFSGVKEIRAEVEAAKKRRETEKRATVLFVDEIHRFNRAQQDAFLPYVEEGILTLVGATTENPSFALNNALLSRARVYVLKPLSEEDLLQLLAHALTDREKGLGQYAIELSVPLRKMLVAAADGDARRVLNLMKCSVIRCPRQLKLLS